MRKRGLILSTALVPTAIVAAAAIAAGGAGDERGDCAECERDRAACR